jgi:hypothetical protein
MEFLSVHLLLRLFFNLFLLVVFVFGAFVSPVSSVPAFEAPSFFHQLVLFVERQSVNVHSIWVPFPAWEVIFSLWNFLLASGSPGSFNCSL